MHEVTMPKLSNTMEVGQIIRWHVKEGDAVREHDVLAEIESDKAVMELESPHEGMLARIVRGEGEEVPVGEVIAYVGAAGEEPPPEGAAYGKEKRTGVMEETRGTERPAAAPAPTEAEKLAPPTPQLGPVEAPGERIAVSPAARKLAEEKGIDVRRLKGSGPRGRILTVDVEKAAAEKHAGQVESQPTAKSSVQEELPMLDVTHDEANVEEIPFRMKTMVRRLVAAQRDIPHFYLTGGVDVTALMKHMDELKEKQGATVTHVVILACLKTLERHPEVNRSYNRDRMITWKSVNLGLAVDTDKGLTVGVMPRAQGLSLREIVERTRALVDAAVTGRLSVEQRRHPTLTITNLGMFGVEEFAPVINPPSSVTLAVGAALEKPVVKDGQVRVGKVMNLTLSCDHRALDGAAAARFLKDLKTLLEDPDRLLADA
jgi:pyruvate dehydrogenase E2 component (dihydrolipoamide acetyltransferase)